ncbi:MAG TPA: hypothetical protein PLX96_04860 [Candidatus Omnitrophota bacterium]|jgi:hypothetical protein|nr:hypothetical protein [Candidatus Omnitrophota bacterium]
MTFFSAFIFPPLLGCLLIAPFLQHTRFPQKILFLSAVSFPIGYGACSLLLFFAYLVAPPVATWTTLVAGLGIMIFSVKKLLSSFRPTRLSFWAKSIGPFSLPKFNLLPTVFLITGFLLFVFILIRTLDFYSLTISLNVFGGWDAYYFWALKAKFMFRAPAEWQNLFSPDLFWTHPDYPLLLPGSLAWGWLWLGKEAFLWAPFLAIGFYLSCAFLLIWYLTSTVSAFTGYLGASFFLILGPCFFWAVHFYADVPLSFFIAGATLTAIIALREKEEKLWRVSGLLSGLAAWTKNEGILFILSFSCLLMAILFFEKIKSKRQFSRRLYCFLSGAILPVLAILILKTFLGTTGDYLGSGRTLFDYLTLLFSGWDRVLLLLNAYRKSVTSFTLWRGLWGFFLIAVFYLGFRNGRSRYKWVPVGIFLLVNLGYAVAILTSPYNLEWQIQTAFERLLLHTVPLVLAFSFETLALSPNHQ